MWILMNLIQTMVIFVEVLEVISILASIRFSLTHVKHLTVSSYYDY